MKHELLVENDNNGPVIIAVTIDDIEIQVNDQIIVEAQPALVEGHTHCIDGKIKEINKSGIMIVDRVGKKVSIGYNNIIQIAHVPFKEG